MIDILHKRILEKMENVTEIFYCCETSTRNCVRLQPRKEAKLYNDFPQIVIDQNKKDDMIAEIDIESIRAKIRKMKGL